MGTLTMETVRPEVGVRAAKTSPVIVATDGRDQSDAALVAGGLLAGASDERLRVITVLKPMPIVSPEAQLPVSPDVEASRRAEAKRTVREQLGRVWNVPFDASVEVYDGDPATTIANVAHESNASMIVSGLGRHRVMDRLFGDETALRHRRGDRLQRDQSSRRAARPRAGRSRRDDLPRSRRATRCDAVRLEWLGLEL
jgi:nucleotide-binding universal stress UspA family protein